jgi:intracellular septation protein
MTRQRPPHLNPLLKLLLELGPLGIFFVGNFWPAAFAPIMRLIVSPDILASERVGIFTATAMFMPATVIALVVHYWLVKKLPIMPLVSGVVVLVFGSLTLLLHNDVFIKLKPTIVNSLFGAVLLGGLAFGRPLLSVVLDSVFELTQEGWRKLTFRWGVFFFCLAALNEVIWRTQTTDFWVSFKAWGIMPITLVFALAQTPLMMRYAKPEGAPEEPQTRSTSLIE